MLNVNTKNSEVQLRISDDGIMFVPEQVEKLVTIVSNPRQYKIPDWFLNRQKDVNDGKYSQVMANYLETKLREDLERLKKIRAHRGLRHYWG